MKRAILAAIYAAVLAALPAWWLLTRVYRAPLPHTPASFAAYLAAHRALDIRVAFAVESKDAVRVSPQLLQSELAAFASSQGLGDGDGDGDGDSDADKDSGELRVRYVFSARKATGGSNAAPGDEYTLRVAVDPARETAAVAASRGRVFDVVLASQDDATLQVAALLKLFFAGELRAVRALASGRDANDLHQIKTLPYAAAYQLSLNLLVENPETLLDSDKRVIAQWRETNGLADKLAGFVGYVSDLHSFEVSSQIHYYTALPIDQFRDAATREVAVPTGMLSKLLHHSESWQHLEIPTSLLAPVRLCLYIPDRAQYGRVQFQGGNSSTYSLPRWGSVHILNADDTVDGVVSAFMQGIKSALGFLDAPKDNRITLSGVNEYDADALMRYRLVENTLATRHTLGSLFKIADDMQNMVIEDDIVALVARAIGAYENIANTRDPRAAFQHAARASRDSDEAFFHPSVVSLLYFPDEHKYAVYMPLFIPVLVPMLVSLYKELRRK